MIEYQSAVGVSHFERKRSGVFEVRQVIARERVTQRIVRPIVDARGVARRVQPLWKVVRRYDAFVFAKWQQPFAEIPLYLYETASRRLALLRRDLNQVVVEVNVRPIQPLQLCAPQSGESADCHVRKQLRRSGFEKPSSLLHSQDAGWCVDLVGLLCFRRWIAGREQTRKWGAERRPAIPLFLYEIILWLFEIALVLVRFNHVVRFIVNANDGVV